MNKRKERLLEFVRQYGEDFLEFPEKDSLIKRINNDDKLVNDLIQAIDKKWVDRVLEIGKFVTFLDYRHNYRNYAGNQREFYSAGYIDDGQTGERRIPLLRHVIVKNREAERDYLEDEEYYDYEI